jgi:predicted metal-binding membrane protein
MTSSVFGEDRNRRAEASSAEMPGLKAVATPRMRRGWFFGERAFVIAGLTGAVLCAWAYLVPTSLDMYGRMDGPAGWMMEATWDARYLLLIFLMWAVMMVGMMLPSALPTILLFRRVVHKEPNAVARLARTFAFASGYVAAWTLFSAMATLLQWGLAEAALLSPMMVSASPWLGGAILVVAGAYQWSPLKNVCVAHCRSPLAFLVQHWRPGALGALRLGLHHGLYCVGCCWALMLLLFFGGVMSLLWIGAITAFVLLEKVAPYGVQGGRLSGAALVLTGAWVLYSAGRSYAAAG